MKRIMTITSAFLAAILILLVFASCGIEKKADQTSADETTTKRANAAQAPQSVQIDETDATVITLRSGGAAVAGEGATVKDTDVLIQSGGTYTVRGTSADTRIVVDTNDADVTLVLDGAQITASNSSAIYICRRDYQIHCINLDAPSNTARPAPCMEPVNIFLSV